MALRLVPILMHHCQFCQTAVLAVAEQFLGKDEASPALLPRDRCHYSLCAKHAALIGLANARKHTLSTADVT